MNGQSVDGQRRARPTRGRRESSQACQYLEWDSAFFGWRIGRSTLTRLSEAQWLLAERWCAEHRIDCLYLLIEADSIETVAAAQARGFRFVDLRATLARRVPEEPDERTEATACRIRPWSPADLRALKDLASVNHRDGRFYADDHFARSRCNALYATWIENSCHGYADAVFVAELEGTAQGYLSCHVSAAGEGRIGLVGVSDRARGRHLGTDMMQHALGWFAARKVQRVTVVTRGGKSEAIRFYERSGFVTNSLQLWFHGWR